jgi:transglutaminase-like putative cysteine protease
MLRSTRLLRIVWCEICSLAVVLTGDIPLWLSISVLVLIPVFGLASEKSKWLGPARTVSSILAVCYLLFFPLDWLVLSDRLIFAVVHLMFYLKLHLLLHLGNQRERKRLYVLCLFEMLATASMTVNAIFIFPLILFVLVGALVLILDEARIRQQSQIETDLLRRAFATAVVVGCAVLVLAGGIFVILPRPIYGGFRLAGVRGITTTGLADSVRLGDFGEIKLSRDVVMRLVAGEETGVTPPRWRGSAYDRYQNGGWQRTLSSVELLPQRGPGEFLLDTPTTDPTVATEVLLNPLDTDMLFIPPSSTELSISLRSVFIDPYLTVRSGRRARAGRRYMVRWRPGAPSSSSSVGGVEPLEDWARRRNLQLPDLSDEFDELSLRFAVDGRSQLETAAAVEAFLEEQYRYSLVTPSRGRGDPVEDFLFDSRAGHCEYFATAMVLLLRSRGVPSRLATGFLRGEMNDIVDFEVIRKSNAHAWVEVYDEQRGWIVFDPTPSAPPADGERVLSFLTQRFDSLRLLWDMYVVAFDYERQRGVLGGVTAGVETLVVSGTRWFGAARRKAWHLAGLGGVVLLFFLLSRMRRVRKWWMLLRWPWRFRRHFLSARPESAVRFYGDLLKRLERLGFVKPVGVTPAEYAYSLEERLPGMSELTHLYYRARYGGDELGGEEQARAERLVAAVRLAALSMVDLAGGARRIEVASE